MASFETIQHSHPLLGTLHGRELSNGVVQFRGIPFARIPERFRQSTLADELSLEEKDCTEYSFVCPQQAEEHGAFGGKLPDDVDYRHDELRCLTLTVSAPKRTLLVSSENGNIPVMVYVHGGGFARGANVGGVNDSARIVALARDEGTPVIVVNIQYGPQTSLEFFDSDFNLDLIDDAEKHAEPPCNFGLFDQRMGFRWVKKYISGFGGNAAQITAFGESAGSSSLTYHMCSDEPLFNRAILQSGFPSTISSGQSLSEKDAQYIKLLEFCGIDPNDPARLSKLRHDVAAEKLIDAITALNPFAFTPLDHKTFFPEMPNLANEGKILAKCDWVDSVIIGDAFYEGFIFTHALKLVPCQLFVAYMHEHFGDDTAIQVLEAYGIQPKMDENLFWNRLTYLVGDAMFSSMFNPSARSRTILLIASIF
ncbi:hypothetical protein TCE0_044r16652 [Talaromyces pinophilus]|uniref:Carboxylesterase type B domain-containing protein n=1 Tax=Talaromyces pinophilus TaxID=128442 RepID=A0A478ED82_TALPI|nr:hypothetical protein TCE0_044r16652 [Talaromyces pinophilus]